MPTKAELEAEVARLRKLVEQADHPTRVKIIVWLEEVGRGSPVGFAEAHEEVNLSEGAYHFKVLLKRRSIKLSGVRPVRGATEHIYKLNRGADGNIVHKRQKRKKRANA